MQVCKKRQTSDKQMWSEEVRKKENEKESKKERGSEKSGRDKESNREIKVRKYGYESSVELKSEIVIDFQSTNQKSDRDSISTRMEPQTHRRDHYQLTENNWYTRTCEPTPAQHHRNCNAAGRPPCARASPTGTHGMR
ncbi:hypothetical protein EVAR_15826_1 [Eumeta japonica]|uniref:Uncharacterized protein n=1 Tax=Eumeta variegata TaxID=151549 RepID=A0A4C1UER8_EUMVA|nr:hypothetical protein EVAR_15826_1 [Eumeta japonica]